MSSMVGTIPRLSLCAGMMTATFFGDSTLILIADLSSTNPSAATTSASNTATGMLSKTASD